MTVPPPINFTYEGDGQFSPAGPYWAKKADEHYVVGQSYRLAPYEERSARSHAHFFACVNDAWGNLSDDLLDQYPSPDHLRARALIETGFCTMEDFVARNEGDAIKLAAFLRRKSVYSLVQIEGRVVRVFEPESQSYRAMGKARFQQSKDKVLDWISQLIGTSVDALKENAKRAA